MHVKHSAVHDILHCHIFHASGGGGYVVVAYLACRGPLVVGDVNAIDNGVGLDIGKEGAHGLGVVAIEGLVIPLYGRYIECNLFHAYEGAGKGGPWRILVMYMDGQLGVYSRAKVEGLYAELEVMAVAVDVNALKAVAVLEGGILYGGYILGDEQMLDAGALESACSDGCEVGIEVQLLAKGGDVCKSPHANLYGRGGNG